MTVHDVFAASRVLIVAGKGGVGKTTVGAAIAFAAAQDGYHVLLIELEGYSNLGYLLDVDEIGYEPVTVDVPARVPGDADDTAIGTLEVMQLKPDEALADYLDRSGLGPIVRRFSRSDAIEVVSAAAPGIRDLVTLGKIRQMEEAEVADLIVVDAPASGHAISFLSSPSGLADSATSGPIKEQADQVLALLADDSRCQVMLVTLAEETPVTETIETAFALEEDVGVNLGPVIVNGLWGEVPGLAEALAALETQQGKKSRSKKNLPETAAIAAARYRQAKIADQSHQVDRLEEELPLPQLPLPFLFTTSLGPDGLSALADALRVAAGGEQN